LGSRYYYSFWFCVNDEAVVEKNKGSYTAKSLLWKMMMILRINKSPVSFDLIFPHSKIVEIINVATDKMQKKNFFEGHHSKALDTVSGILIDVLPPSYLS
jgi:hypothetical protein